MNKNLIIIGLVLILSVLVVYATSSDSASLFTRSLNVSGNLTLHGEYINLTGVNGIGKVLAQNYSGNLTWSDLYGFPVACPSGSYLTQLGDSVTCTVLDGVVGSFKVNGTLYVMDPNFNNGNVSIAVNALNVTTFNVGEAGQFNFSVSGVQDFLINSTGAYSFLPIFFDSGRAITGNRYMVARDADATNQLHFNVPTGATYEFSVNDVASVIVSAGGTINSGSTGNSNLILQNQGFTPGAGHNSVEISPAWTAEDFTHTGLRIQPTQSGANSGDLVGLTMALTKATGATTLTTMTSIFLEVPTVTGTVTNSRGISISDMSPVGGTTADAILIGSQTANAVTTRAIRIQGTGANNAIELGDSALLYANVAENIRFMDSTNGEGIEFILTNSNLQTINTVGGSLNLSTGNVSRMSINGTTGYVGINNSNPQELLHVGNSTQASAQAGHGILMSNTGQAWVSARDPAGPTEAGVMAIGTVGYVGTWTSHQLIFRTGDTDRWNIDTNGNLGSNTAGGVLRFGAGDAITATEYELARDADATNQLHFNVPTGAGFEWSINDVAILNIDTVDGASLIMSGSGYGIFYNGEMTQVRMGSTADAATSVPLVARGAVAQSVNLFEARNSANAAIFSVNANGDIWNDRLSTNATSINFSVPTYLTDVPTSGLPSLIFEPRSNLGLIRLNDTELAFSVNGSNVTAFTPDQVLAPNGTAFQGDSRPGYSFRERRDYGMALNSGQGGVSSSLDFVTDGTSQLTITNTTMTVALNTTFNGQIIPHIEIRQNASYQPLACWIQTGQSNFVLGYCTADPVGGSTNSTGCGCKAPGTGS